jgi:asparagine synthase (glutamine-hydrolysing)
MSGICGILLAEDAPRESDGGELLRRGLAHMLRRVRSRGQDGCLTHVDKRCGVGVATNREYGSVGARVETLLSRCGRFAIVFDGRLDNRAQLKFDLSQHHALDCTHSDAEIALAAFQQWEGEAPQRFRGDFAYAIWDCAEKKIHAARDPLCARPLYFVRRDAFFAFASDERALLGLPGVEFAPNPEQFLQAFYGGGLDYEPDVFRPWCLGIDTLHGGYALEVSSSEKFSVREVQYWREPSHTIPVPKSMLEAVEQLESALVQAVSDRVREQRTPAMLLSGGIDSASVFAAYRSSKRVNGPLSTYSIIADEPEQCVESSAIRAMHARPDVAPYCVAVPSFFDSASADEDFLRHALRQPHPIEASLQYQLPLLAAAKRSGVKTLMTAVGGDVVTDVPDFFPALLLRNRGLKAAIRASQAASKNWVYLRHKTAASIFLRSCLATTVNTLPIPVLQLLRGARGATRNLLSGEMHKKTRTNAVLKEQLLLPHNFPRSSRIWSPEYFDRALNAPRALDWLAHGQIGYDRSFGRFGIANADVWSDLRVIQVYLNMPVEFRVNDGWTKSPVRRWLSTKGLGDIAWRKDKSHLGHHFNRLNLPIQSKTGVACPQVEESDSRNSKVRAISNAVPAMAAFDIDVAIRYVLHR